MYENTHRKIRVDATAKRAPVPNRRHIHQARIPERFAADSTRDSAQACLPNPQVEPSCAATTKNEQGRRRDLGNHPQSCGAARHIHYPRSGAAINTRSSARQLRKPGAPWRAKDCGSWDWRALQEHASGLCEERKIFVNILLMKTSISCLMAIARLLMSDE